MNKIDIVIVDKEYCNYLRKFDKLVPYNFANKINRPYIGVLFEVNKCKYFAPLSSPKKKHEKMKNTLDFYKLENKFYDQNQKVSKKQVIGAINFNNMIPLAKGTYNKINLNKICENVEERKYLDLLKLDFRCINNNIKIISKKAETLYHLYHENKLHNKIKSRCCNFLLLEEKCREYKDSNSKNFQKKLLT